MKAAAFDYSRADHAQDALKLLTEYGGAAKLMAGSQSLGPMLNLRLARPAHVIDISNCADLRQVTLLDRVIRVGACVTHAEIEDGVFELLRGHPLQQVAARIAYRAVRNRGTIGGSLAHADPAADWVLACMAMNANIEIMSKKIVRKLPMREFMLAAYTTALADDEIITAIEFPLISEQTRWGYYKFCRKTGEFAEASCAVLIDPVARVSRVVVGALDGPPGDLPVIAHNIARNGFASVSFEDIVDALSTIASNKDLIDRKLYANAVRRSLALALGAVESI